MADEEKNAVEDDDGAAQKWHDSDKILLGWAIVFFPIAIYGIWQRKDYDQNTRWTYTAITVVVAMGLLSFDSITRHAMFFLATPAYAWYIWKDVGVDKALKMPLMVGAVLIVLSGFSELASGPRGSSSHSNKACPRTETTSGGRTIFYDSDCRVLPGYLR